VISFVCWLWNNWQRMFLPEYVNILRAMVRRHYPLPHRFICITEDTAGLDEDIETLFPPVRFDGVPSSKGPRFPSCYRRLWNFSREACHVLGPRIMALDIDVVITRSLVPLVTRDDPFVSWTDPRFGWNKVPGGLYLLTTGTHADVWEEFDPERSPAIAARAGCHGSDQAWMSYKLYPPRAAWTADDGVVSIKWLTPGKPLPKHVRIVSTPGELKPWSPELQKRHPWIREHWTR
jgi:hypothetical protein